MFSRRQFLAYFALGLLAGCTSEPPALLTQKLTIGVVSYGESTRSLDRYTPFQEYLAGALGAVVELEPALNELLAIARIEQRSWSLVFAPPGLAAIAIATQQYIPLFAMEGVLNQRSLLVVRKDSPLQKIDELNGKRVAIGQAGSATGYYLPIYDLYGLTLAEVLFAPTPKIGLDRVADGTVSACALSAEEFDRYRRDVRGEFRILHASSLGIPPGAVLLGPTIERNLQEQITQAMRSAPPAIADDAGYLPTAPLPNYRTMIQVVERVRPIAARIRQKPAPLYERDRK